MAFTPITGSALQYMKDSVAADGFYIKFYASGTTTPISMATDDTGGTLLAKAQFNSQGYAINGSGAPFIPHIDQKYKVVFYPNATDADNNTFANADFNIDLLEPASAAANAAVPKNFATLALAIANTGLVAGDALNLAERTTGNGGGAMWDVVLSSTVTENTFDIVQATGVGTLSLVLRSPEFINQKASGAVGDDSADDTAALDLTCYNFGETGESVYIPDGTYRSSTFRTNNVHIVAQPGAQINLFEVGSQPTLVQIGTDSYIEGLTFQSTETDLDNQSARIQGANKVQLNRCNFKGFRDVTGATDAWGLYLDTAVDVVLTQIGFDDNTQSDLVFVDNNKNITVNGCYAIGSVFHVNFEPNTSVDFNENITLNGMHITKLSMLENGSGGVSNRAITVSGCEIDLFVYDGAQVTLTDCNVTAWATESAPFFGEIKLNNTTALGPNLLEDPYMVNVGFSSGDATTDSNAWYMNLRTGSIGGNQLDSLEENGVRFIRINPTNASGTINFTTSSTISVTTGDYYLVAITGRRGAGSSATFMTVFDGSTDLTCRIFRQSAENNNNFVTEMLVVPAVTGNFSPKVGLWQTGTDSVDIHAITIHKVLGVGGNESSVLGQYHDNIYGPRTLLPVAVLPTFSDDNVRGVFLGDKVTLTTTGTEYYWSGAAWVPVGTLASASSAQLNDIAADINTNAAKVQGYRVYNQTAGIYTVASGNADGSVWVYEGTGNTQHTPV